MLPGIDLVRFRFVEGAPFMHSVSGRWPVFVVVATLSLALSGCGSLQAPVPVETAEADCADWSKPKNATRVTTAAYSFLLPKSWVDKTNSEMNTTGAMSLYADKSTMKTTYVDNISVESTTVGTNMSVKEYELALVNEVKNGGFSVVKFSNPVVHDPVSLGGIKAAYITAKAKVRQPKVSLVLTVLGVTDRQHRYAIGIGSLAGRSSTKAAFIKDLRCSWKWTN